MKKSIKLILLVVSLLILLASCAGIDEILDDDEIRGYTEAMLDALISNDYNTAYGLVADTCTEQQFKAFYNQARAALQGAQDYKLTCIGYNNTTTVKNGKQIKRVDAEYKFVSGDLEYVVTVSTLTGYKKLAGFHITPVENSDLYSTGTLGNMAGASALQWAVLLLNLVVIAVTVIAIVDCARRRIKKKALWIIIILLVSFLVSRTQTANSFDLYFNFTLGLFNYSAYIIYGSGKTIMRIIIPLGAIIYFCARKTLERKASQQYAQQPYTAQFCDTQAVQDSSQEPNQPQAPNPEQISAVYCTKCGNKNDANAKFCCNCGEKINED